MQKIPVKIKLLHADAKLPTYGSEESAGFDVYAIADEIIKPGEVKKIPTGLSYELPEGYHLQVWDRSSMASKGIHHFAGVLDSDYRGEVSIMLYNSGKEEFKIEKGQRIVQIIIIPIFHGQFEMADKLGETSRGAGGFGSTGK